MWADVTRNLASVLGGEIYQSLLHTPSYTAILRKGGVRDPFPQPGAGNLPKAFRETWQVYAALIVAKLRQAGSLAEDTVKATVVSGPLTLYRAMDSHRSRPDENDLRRDTAYFGDWWFEQALLDECRTRCNAMEAQRRRDPLLTVMAQGQCLRVMLRRKLAVSKDWSKIGAIRKLVLHASDRIPVITGVGLPMGIYSEDGRQKTTREAAAFPVKKVSKPDALLSAASQLLPGGAAQIWMPFTPEREIALWAPPGGFGEYAKLGP
jgi:hypothetical protein